MAVGLLAGRSLRGVVVQVGPWPWSLLTALSAVMWLGAVFTAWRSADRVIRKNRGRTRAWRVFLTCLGITVSGVPLAFGAAYVLVRYHQQSRSRRSVVA